MESKENIILEKFYNYPLKPWHFCEIKHEVKIADSKLSKWLNKLQKEKIITRFKTKGNRPYYKANHESPEYRNSKRLFGYKNLNDSGLLNYLSSINADLVVIFGSFARSDWHKISDIDLFVYGAVDENKIHEFSRKLKREIQLFHCKNRKSFGKIGDALIKNILLGYVIKGNLNFLEVTFHARQPKRNLQIVYRQKFHNPLRRGAGR
jgi:DNA-binding Lrp family transcriptional regulator